MPFVNRVGSPIVATSAGPPISARPGRLRASLVRIDLAICGLAFGGMHGEFRFRGLEQPHFGRDLGGEVGERDRAMAGVKIDRGVRGGEPFLGAVKAEMTVRRLDDRAGEPFQARVDQHIRVCPTLEDHEIGVGHLPRQRAHRHQLTHQRLDPRLAIRDVAGQAIRGPDSTIQPGSFRIGQHQRLDSRGMEQRDRARVSASMPFVFACFER